MHSKVEDALDKVRPALRADGGDARVVACDEENGSVSIQMLGACKGCPLSQLDFVYAIESLIRREVPEVQGDTRGIGFALAAGSRLQHGQLDRAATASLLPQLKNCVPDAVGFADQPRS